MKFVKKCCGAKLYLNENCCKKKKKQVQRHGFEFENRIRYFAFKLHTKENDTNVHDIDKTQNRFDKTENISIKTSGSNNICFGDLIRFFRYNFSEKNTIIIVKYKQNGDYKIIEKIYEINYNKEMHEYLFGDVKLKTLEDYIKKVKNIKKDINAKEAKKIWNYIAEKKKIMKDNNMNITINPKINSKGQRRVQCSININKIQKYIILKKTNEVRGYIIPKKRYSPKNKRKNNNY